MTHPISQSTLCKAAAGILEITDAGYRHQLEREYWERIRELPPHQRQERCRDPMREMDLEHDAKLLALLTDAPLYQCRAAVREVSGDMAKREVGLTLIRELSGEVRKLRAQENRTRFTRRQSA